MDKKKFSAALKKAQKCESMLKHACSDLEFIFQPYFSDEISVLYQPADGFVILHDTDMACGWECGNKNTGVKEAFECIQENPKHYIRTKDK